MTGKEIQTGAIAFARTKGYRVAHFTSVTDSRGFNRTPVAADGKGWPDLFLVGRKAVAVEVKGDGDRLRPEQREWLAALEKAGISTLVLTSKAWLGGALEELLDA